MLANRMAQHIQIVEVSPRDGLQADPADLTTDQKVELISRLVDAGHTRIEAASFVSPKAVPKMADGDDVMASVPRVDGVTYSALAFNQRGVDRAVAADVDEVTGVVVASETFSQRNSNATIAESIERWRDVCSSAKEAGLRTSVTIAASFGCPFEGRVDPAAVIDIAKQLVQTAPDELALADTIGVAVPSKVAQLFTGVRSIAGEIPLRGHFHNTRNTALANILAAIDEGVHTFDTSLGGVGGCPFAPRATGNVPTEDVAYMLHEMGYTTGLDLDRLIESTGWLEDVLQHATPGLVAKAGGFPTP
jgi:hydroxymethylglutaryl-CoA lyase